MTTNMLEVSGGSDDLICVQGAIDEEFGYHGETVRVGCSDGTLLTVDLDDDGAWRVNQLGTGRARYEKVREGKPDTEEYSDLVRLTLPAGEAFTWVIVGKAVVAGQGAL